MELREYLKKQRDLVDRYIDQYLPVGVPKELFDAMAYSVKAGGKRLRPILVIESVRSINTSLDINLFMDVAVAVEFIHTYSLIHDDLPAMDDDDLRRGKPTCH